MKNYKDELDLFVISDFGSLNENEINDFVEKVKGKHVLLLGDILSKKYAMGGNAKKIIEYYDTLFKWLEENTKFTGVLLGNNDVNERITQKLLKKYKKIQPLYRIYEISDNTVLGLPNYLELEELGVYVVSWGNGAGIGGLRGYEEEISLYKQRYLPNSALTIGNIQTPLYSGLIYGNSLSKILRELDSKEKVIVSHIPPYMGNDILRKHNLIIGDESLDTVEISRVKGLDYTVPTHVGDVFFRIVLEEQYTNTNIKGVYFGHVEEHSKKTTTDEGKKIEFVNASKTLYQVY